MGLSILSWKQGGRGWARGAPPPPGSIEYCGVGGEAFYGVGSVWVVSATEVEAGNRWSETLARSVDYARRVHGDRVLSTQDARDFTDYYRRWRKFADRVSTWSLVQRAREENKRVLEALVAESRRLSDRFTKKGMAVVPVPHAADLVLMLREVPLRLTPPEMARKLETAARWGEDISAHSRTTGEWVQRAGLYAAGAALGPAGILAAHYLPSSWSRDRAGLEAASRDAREAARYLSRSTDSSVPYTRGDPVYDEFLRKVTKVYVEAAGLYGVQETLRAATAEAVDAGSRQVERGRGSLLWLLALAGVSYLGVKWLESSRERTVVLRVPDAAPPEEV